MVSTRDDDPSWEGEFAATDDEKATEIDKREVLPEEAVPAAVSAHDTTGKYKTLSYVAADVRSELAFGRGCAHCTKKVLTAFKLWLMSKRVDPTAAQVRVDELIAWMHDPRNAELIRVALDS